MYFYKHVGYGAIPKCPGTKFDGIKVQKYKNTNPNDTRGSFLNMFQVWGLLEGKSSKKPVSTLYI